LNPELCTGFNAENRLYLNSEFYLCEPVNITDAVGGLPGSSTDNWVVNGEDYWDHYDWNPTLMIGQATTAGVTFLGATNATRREYLEGRTQLIHLTNGTKGFAMDAFASGAENVCFLDGGTSIALALRRSYDVPLAVEFAGLKHHPWQARIESLNGLLGKQYSIRSYIGFNVRP